MPISQKEGYFENTLYRFSEPMLFPLAWKWNLYGKAFSSVKTKTNPNFAVNLLKKATIHFSVLIMECINLIYCVNIWKRSEAANQPFLYWIEWNTSLSLWVSLICGIFSGSFFLDNLEWPFFLKLWWQRKIIFLQMHNTILQTVK